MLIIELSFPFFLNWIWKIIFYQDGDKYQDILGKEQNENAVI